jgi:hypothetical protein
MLHHKTAVTGPALAAAKEHHVANEETKSAAEATFRDMLYTIAQHDSAAAAADRAAIEHGDALSALVGCNADEGERAPVRALQADQAALAAFHRKQAAEKRLLLPDLERHTNRARRAVSETKELDTAEFNDAMAAYLEMLPVIEPVVTRLRAAAQRDGRQVNDDAHQFSALPKIQGGQIFGQRLEREHYAPVSGVTQ